MFNAVKDKRNALTLICLITTYVSFGLVYLMISFSLETFPPVILSCMRYFAAGVCFLFWAYAVRKERRLPSTGDWRIMLTVASGMMVVKGGFLIYSEVYTPSGIVAVMLGSTPMWMVVFGWLFFHDKKPAPITAAGLLIGFAGVVIITVSAVMQDGRDDHMARGVLLTGIAVLGGTLGSLYSKNKKTGLGTAASFGYQMIFASAVFLAAALLLGEPYSFSFAEVSAKSWLSFAALVLLGSILGFSAYLWLLYNAPSGVSTSYTYVEPILAVAAGVLFGGEKLTFSLVAGCVFIAISVFIIIIRRDLWRRGPF